MYFNHLHLSKKQITAVLVFLFSIFGIQSSYADYYPSGIQQNVSEQTLRNNGWTLFYEQTYGTIIGNTTTLIRPSGEYVILAGKALGSSTILLAAAAPTAQVFTETEINTPQLLNGAYWYLTLDTHPDPGFEIGSIGFAPAGAVIDQDSADVEDNSDPLRLSWHLDAVIGGYRLGGINHNNGSYNLNGGVGGAAYIKQVWTWNGVSVAPAPAPAPAPVYVRQSTNLYFSQSLYASDTLSDPDGQLRKTVDQIMAKHGSLIK